MSYLTINQAIVQKFDEIEGTKNDKAKIYGYQRIIKNGDVLKSLFKTPQNKLHGWIITQRSIRQEPSANKWVEYYRNFLFRGYMGVDDSQGTEITFNLIVDQICEAFRIDQDLYDTVKSGNLQGSGITVGLPQVEIIDYRMFYPVLCHFAEISYWCRERKEDASR